MSSLPSQHLRRAPALSDEIARRLGQEIREGRRAPGDRLPTEREIGEAFGVSRAVVREAISRLKQEGMIVSVQGRGAFVSSTPEGSAFRMEQINLDDQQELAHIIELIATFEVEATALAAERRTEEDLQAIKRCLDDMYADIEEGRTGVDDDLCFHTQIVKATGNPYFVELLGVLENRARKLIRAARTNSARYKGLAQEAQGEHQAIFDAIEAGDRNRARRAATRHLKNAAKRLQLYRKIKAPAQSAE